MKNIFIFLAIISTALFSCTKGEGQGGRSSIIGKIHMTDKTGGTQGTYFAPDYDVYILYGDKDDIYDDDVKTNYNGTFEFKNLRKGSYRIYAYTVDLLDPAGIVPVFKAIELGRNDQGDVGTIEVEK